MPACRMRLGFVSRQSSMPASGTKRTIAALQQFVRFWTITDNGELWPEMVCPLLTHMRHGLHLALGVGPRLDG